MKFARRKVKPILKIGLTLIYTSLLLTACGEEGSAPFNSASKEAPPSGPNAPTEQPKKYLYVASGTCYAGGVTMSTPANTISKLDLETGELVGTVIDYNNYNPGDSPIDMIEYDDERMLVLVENTGGRRIDMVKKDGSGASIHLANATALSSAVRSMVLLADFSLLVSRSTAIEKFNPAKARVMVGANAFVNLIAGAGACALSNANITSVNVFPNGKIFYTHANTSPNNKMGLISAAGYNVVGDCLTTSASPTTLAMPTTALLHSSGRTLVAYGSTTLASNSIQTYDVNATTNTISTATASWTDNAIVNGPSAMAEDPETGDIFVANGNSLFNTIERFKYNSSTKLMTRQAGLTYRSPAVFTRCVSKMKVME